MRRFYLQLGSYRFAPGLWPSVAFFVLFPILLFFSGFLQRNQQLLKPEYTLLVP